MFLVVFVFVVVVLGCVVWDVVVFVEGVFFGGGVGGVFGVFLFVVSKLFG